MKAAFLLFISALAVLPALPALAAPPAKKTPSPGQSTVPAAQMPQAKPALGPIAGYAAQNGVRQCVGRIDQISNFLTNGSINSGASVFLAPREPDRGLTTISMEVHGGNGLSYVSTAFSPTTSSCDGAYEAVTYWAGSCEQVAATFSGFTPSNPLRQHIQTLDGGPNAKVYLMPAGQGCISIKKEIIY